MKHYRLLKLVNPGIINGLSPCRSLLKKTFGFTQQNLLCPKYPLTNVSVFILIEICRDFTFCWHVGDRVSVRYVVNNRAIKHYLVHVTVLLLINSSGKYI